MKKIFAAVTVFVLFASGLAAQTVEISFDYTRRRGFASNQFAVWVEDAAGRYIKTLYAARFTAQGGWERREQSLPRWVKKSGVSGMAKVEIDSFTAATPKPGRLSYRWDGTGRDGLPLGAGEYRLVLEATLREENQVVYTAAVRLGSGPAEITPQPIYSGAETADRVMINNVRVRITE